MGSGKEKGTIIMDNKYPYLHDLFSALSPTKSAELVYGLNEELDGPDDAAKASLIEEIFTTNNSNYIYNEYQGQPFSYIQSAHRILEDFAKTKSGMDLIEGLWDRTITDERFKYQHSSILRFGLAMLAARLPFEKMSKELQKKSAALPKVEGNIDPFDTRLSLCPLSEGLMKESTNPAYNGVVIADGYMLLKVMHGIQTGIPLFDVMNDSGLLKAGVWYAVADKSDKKRIYAAHDEGITRVTLSPQVEWVVLRSSGFPQDSLNADDISLKSLRAYVSKLPQRLSPSFWDPKTDRMTTRYEKRIANKPVI